jgi:protocatechuate 3,4-dioxygenase beta subunit
MSTRGGGSRHDHDGGLAADLATLLGRRRFLGLLAGAGAVTLVGCSTGAGGAPATTAGTAVGGAAGCETIPSETAGPYPGDGSNGPNALTESGVVRGDIRSSFGSSSGVAQGVPLAINLTIQDSATGCAPLAGAAVYLWHCDREGRYSLYSPGATGENYLRGVQESDAQGRLAFTSIFPAAYSGRWPHAHFEVYRSVAEATSGGSPLITSQLALPKETCDAVYATPGYEQSVSNLAQTTLARDMVFRDGVDQQLVAVTGSVADGYVASLSVPV